MTRSANGGRRDGTSGEPPASLSAVSALELPPTTDSVPVARRFVREALAGTAVDVDTALLLVSEVATNAVLHARSPFRITIVDGSNPVRIEIFDGSPVPPRLHAFSATSGTGRGLRLLDRLAHSWGVLTNGSGKTVWFEVADPSEQSWTPFNVDELVAE